MKLFTIKFDGSGRIHLSEGFLDCVRDEVRKETGTQGKAPECPPVLLLRRNADGSFGPEFRVAS